MFRAMATRIWPPIVRQICQTAGGAAPELFTCFYSRSGLGSHRSASTTIDCGAVSTGLVLHRDPSHQTGAYHIARAAERPARSLPPVCEGGQLGGAGSCLPPAPFRSVRFDRSVTDLQALEVRYWKHSPQFFSMDPSPPPRTPPTTFRAPRQCDRRP